MAAITPSAIDKTGMTTTEGKDLTNSIHYNDEADEDCEAAGPLHGFSFGSGYKSQLQPKRKCNIPKNNRLKCIYCRSRHVEKYGSLRKCSSCGKEFYAKT